jgi:iron complex transport system permease protein
MRRALPVWLVLALVALATFGAALLVGSASVGAGDVWSALTGGDGTGADVVRRLRFPRAAAAFGCGALLAVSGALMQVLLRNPLADPYVLGVSGGAAVGAIGAMLLGLGAAAIEAFAATGAAASILAVFGLAHREIARRQLLGATDASPRLLLAGVVLAMGWGAVVTMLLSIAPDARLRGMMFWLMGDLNGVEGYGLPLAALVLALAVLWPLGRHLNVLLRGDAVALSLGVDVARVRLVLFAVASIGTAIAVTTCGMIGFVGLVVPHAVRLLADNDQRMLLPASALGGGALLLIADTAARTVAAPAQLPVGAIMAAIGVPCFIAILLRTGRRS